MFLHCVLKDCGLWIFIETKAEENGEGFFNRKYRRSFSKWNWDVALSKSSLSGV